jgi:omega-amidase
MVKLGLVQTKNYSSNKIGILYISKKIESLGKKEVDIVCLPEQWLKDNTIAYFNSEFENFLKIAKEYSMTIIPGAFYENTKNGQVITSPVISPKGEIIGKQNKIHPFGYERDLVKPGNEAKIFKTSCRFGIAICYDMIFPQVTNKFVTKGAQVIFSPSRIVKRGIIPWHIYLQTRSLENRVPIVAANVDSAKYGGKSVIIDLHEDNEVMIPKLQTSKDGESVISREFDLLRYTKSRKERYGDLRKFS